MRTRSKIFRDIVNEMIRFFVGSNLNCGQEGDFYKILGSARQWWRGGKRTWGLHVVEGDVREAVADSISRVQSMSC